MTAEQTNQDLQALIKQANTLIQQITDQAARDQASYNAGYRDALTLCRAMFDHGVDIGRAQTLQDDRHAWAEAAAPTQSQHRAADYQTRTELDVLRYPDHTPEQLAELRRQAQQRYGLPLGTQQER